MLRTRVLTAVALLALLAATATLAPRALPALGALFLGAALFEWLRLAGLRVGAAAGVAGLCAAGAALAERGGVQPGAGALAAWAASACAAWTAIGVLLVVAQRRGVRLPQAFLVASALLLGAAAWFALVDLLHRGPEWTLSVLVPVWVADVAAYFTGRAFGRRRLASRISPGKTWAGVWGALVAVLALGAAVRWAWPDAPLWSTRLLRSAPVLGLAVLAALVALSIVGDLFESLVKRQAGAKDSGILLPGHGGVWDRIDATLPVLPLAVLSQSLFGGATPHA